MKKEVILEGMPARSVRETNPCFITTDPGLRLSRMTATLNNRSWTITFGNDDKQKSKSNRHPRVFLSGICRYCCLHDEQQIPEPCGRPLFRE